VLPCLENLDLPYADDSAAATPTSDDLCSFQNAQNNLTHYQRQQRLSTTSAGIRMSQLEMRFTGGGGGGVVGGMSRSGSRASRQSRRSVVAANAAALSAGATTPQLEGYTPRLKVRHYHTRPAYTAVLSKAEFSRSVLNHGLIMRTRSRAVLMEYGGEGVPALKRLAPMPSVPTTEVYQAGSLRQFHTIAQVC